MSDLEAAKLDLRRALEDVRSAEAALEDAEAALKDHDVLDPDAGKKTVPCAKCGMIASVESATVIYWRNANDGIDRICSACARALRDWFAPF